MIRLFPPRDASRAEREAVMLAWLVVALMFLSAFYVGVIVAML